MQFNRSDENVGNRVFKGAMFLTAGRFILRLFSLVNLVVLGRLLAPEDYGVASLAIVVIGITQVMSDIRVNSALISLKEITTEHLDTGFTINLMRGMIVAAILFAFAGPIATFMEEPKLERVMQVICVILIFDGLRNPAFMMYRRNIDFSKEFRRTAAATVFGSVAAIIVAVLTESYWAIVAGTLAGRFTEMALSYWRVPHNVGLGLTKWREFVGFGSLMTVDAILDYITTVAPQTLIGKVLGAGPLGFYTVGRDISQIATHELAGPLAQAVFPGLAALAEQTERLREAYHKAQSTILGIALPIGCGSALMANEMITLLVGSKWLPQAADVVIFIAPTLAFSMIVAATNGLMMAKLALKTMVWRALLVAVIAIPVYVYAVLEHGFIGMLYANVFCVLLQTFTKMYIAKRLLGDTIWGPFAASWRSFVAVAAMIGAVLMVPAPFAAGQSEFTVFVEMMPRVLLGAATYLAVHLGLWQLAGKPDGFERKMLEILKLAWTRIQRQS